MANPAMAFLLFLLLPFSILLLLYFVVRPRHVRVPIKGRHIFITGGSSGIGLALAHAAAAEGASKVSILARDPKKLEDAKEEIRRLTGVEAATFSVDVRDFDAVRVAVEEAGPIDVLVCNHGLFAAQELERQQLSEVRSIIDANLMGTIHLIKAALPSMKINRKDRGPASIAIVSSQIGQMGIYGYAAYCSTKFGLRGLAEALQQEVIAHDVYVSLIFPPDTETPGLIQDRRCRPHITKFICASSSTMTADEVAKISINGIKRGRFVVICNLFGFLLSITTAGCCPQTSYVMTFIEVVAAGAGRLLILFYQRTFYDYIKKWHAQNKEK
ncbi:hypothetical protein Dimus_010143 [Dionaea muscipula]